MFSFARHRGREHLKTIWKHFIYFSKFVRNIYTYTQWSHSNDMTLKIREFNSPATVTVRLAEKCGIRFFCGRKCPNTSSTWTSYCWIYCWPFFVRCVGEALHATIFPIYSSLVSRTRDGMKRMWAVVFLYLLVTEKYYHNALSDYFFLN